MKKDYSHFRRCHVCGACSEQKDFVNRCANCGKVFAPFYYYDELQAPCYAENLTRPPLAEGEFSPILGISTHWWYQDGA